MLQTIEVEIDANGRILPLEPLPTTRAHRAYLTFLPEVPATAQAVAPQQGSAAQALELLASPRFAHRPAADPAEVQQRIDMLRNEWVER